MAVEEADLEALCRAVPPDRPPVVPTASLAEALGRCIDRAHVAWPRLTVPTADFAAWLGARIPEPAESTEPAAALEALEVEALYLACGCARGDAQAIAALEQTHGAALRRALARVADPHLRPEDLAQIVRNKLLVGDEHHAPVITQYAGQGSLGSWLRVVSVRTAFNATRRKQPQLGESADVAEQLDQVVEQIDDPELGYLRDHYQAQFREAFAEAAQALDSRQRNLLRQSTLHGLGVRDLGRMYGVHYATASRWLAQARQQLVVGTRERLAGRLAVGEGELQSIMRLIQRDFDITLGRVLKTMS